MLRFDQSFAGPAAVSIPLVLLGCFLAATGPVLMLQGRQEFVRGTIPVLTWDGLRGGISIALALSLPKAAEKPPLLAATYAVVVITIMVEGLSLRAVLGRTF